MGGTGDVVFHLVHGLPGSGGEGLRGRGAERAAQGPQPRLFSELSHDLGMMQCVVFTHAHGGGSEIACLYSIESCYNIIIKYYEGALSNPIEAI